MNNIDKCVRITMPDATWAVPVMVIAKHRAAYYAHEFGGDIEKSLAEDTVPLFFDDLSEAIDWLVCNMNWDDVKNHVVGIPAIIKPVNHSIAWVSAPMEIIDPPTAIVANDAGEAARNKAIIDRVDTILRERIETAGREYINRYAVRSEVSRLLAQKDLATFILSEIANIMENY